MKLSLAIIFLAIGTHLFAQVDPPANWYNLDYAQNRVQGASVELAYELLKGRESDTVIVAVIDSGVDIAHEDLQGKIWQNRDEIAGNGIDDDNNSYVDDVNGWNFIGGKDGSQVEFDTYEITREYAKLKAKYDMISYVEEEQEAEFDSWKEIKRMYKNRSKKAMQEFAFYRDVRNSTADYMTTLKDYLKVDELNSDTLDAIMVDNPEVMRAKNALTNIARLLGDQTDFESLLTELSAATHHFEVQVKYGYNTEYNTREIVGDNWEDAYEVGYGNNIVNGPAADHGTHVAGIIAANRSNELGTRGVAEKVVIMPIRAVPNGDERDKDVAAAIRYAVDNGARVINMSFGKSFENRREVVDESIKYAAQNGVLMISSAGNSNKDSDIHTTYPSPVDSAGVKAKNWISIGAIGWKADENFVASFSNYGRTTIDLFSPGVKIKSTYPDNQYVDNDGTSMASPVVSGVAALILSHFPELSGEEVRQLLLDSVTTFPELEVKIPGKEEMALFADLSITGGVINAAKAVELALERMK